MEQPIKIDKFMKYDNIPTRFAMTSEFGNAASDFRWHDDDPKLDYAKSRDHCYRLSLKDLLVGRLFQKHICATQQTKH